MLLNINTSSKQLLHKLLACCLVFLFSCIFTVSAFGAETNTVTVSYRNTKDNTPIVGIDVYAYKVANITDGQVTLTDEFIELENVLGWNANGTNFNDANWNKTQAETLDFYIRAGNYIPFEQQVTDENGCAKFETLDYGLYLILTTGDLINRFQSVFVENSNDTNLNMVVEPKTSTPNNPVSEIQVIKQWKNDTTQDRPRYVLVQLVCDGENIGTEIKLDDTNHWTYSWTGLDISQNHNWSVIELDVPNNYSVSITEKEGMFTVTNTLNTPETPTNPEEPKSSNKYNSNNITSDTTKLPQTGQLWWPVPILIWTGAILILIGAIITNKSATIN